jgi:phospholipid/cholesterol/gamma-HCH transport system ATP-binding protein
MSNGNGGASHRDARQPPPPDSDPSLVRRAGAAASTGDAIGAPVGPDDIVVLRNVKKSYDEQQVLKGIDLVARRKETVVIIGGSGAGKTTLLRLIVALDRPTSGEILVEGENIATLPERELNRIRKKFGMVYQYAALLDSINVLDNIAFPLVEHTKLSRKEINERVMEKLEILGLDPKVVATKFPAELSGGMRKRVGLARALMLEPPILVYDEPTSGLDPLTSRLVDDLIEEMRVRFNVTSIVISHDIASCFRIAHQAVLLIQGKVEAQGPPDSLLEGGSTVAREFIRNSGVDVKALSRVTQNDGEAAATPAPPRDTIPLK